MSDTAPDATTLALKFRAEGEAAFKAASQEREAAEYKRQQIERRHRDIEELEANISRREAKLRELNEPAFLEREQAAADKLAQAQELMAQYSADKHGAAQALIAINEREAARGKAA